MLGMKGLARQHGQMTPRLLYLTSEYPHISHTFIRREIQGLEARGYEILRVSIHPGLSNVTKEDEHEAKITQILLGGPKLNMAHLVVKGLFFSKLRIFKALSETFLYGRVGFRGPLRQIAYLLEALALLAICRERVIDHIHVHFGTNPATVAHLSKLLGGPTYSLTVHGPVEFDQPHSQRLGIKCDAALFTLAISSYCRSQLYRWVSVEAWRSLHIVGCSVGEEWFDASRPIPAESKEIVAIGRLDEQKGQLLLVDALADALAKGADLSLAIIGDGPFRSRIQVRIDELGLNRRIKLMGWADAELIRSQLTAARALVLPSFAEGLPVVIMESMALQRPVIASRIAGIPELVRDGKEGWLITPGDRDALAESLIRLSTTSVAALDAMGRAAQDRVRERHHTGRIVEKIDELFQLYLPK